MQNEKVEFGYECNDCTDTPKFNFYDVEDANSLRKLHAALLGHTTTIRVVRL